MEWDDLRNLVLTLFWLLRLGNILLGPRMLGGTDVNATFSENCSVPPCVLIARFKASYWVPRGT